MKLYKLTTQDHKTRKGYDNETQWSEGFTLETNGEGDLCGPGFVHAYTHPLLAVLLNPIHADIYDPVMWECEGEIVKSDRGLKVGCTKLTTVKTIELPEVTIEQRIRFAIFCALEVYQELEFVEWANKWLSGEDRSYQSAFNAAEAAEAAEAAAAVRDARAAVWAARATWAAVNAAKAVAVNAADAAAEAAVRVAAVRAAVNAADAAAEAARAARAAARAARAAARAADADAAVRDARAVAAVRDARAVAASELNLITLAEKAMEG